MLFLTVLSKHLIFFILDEWLCSWSDFASLDLAMTNKELRKYFYAPDCQVIGKINNDITINIMNGESFISLIKWKDKRLFAIAKLRLNYFYLHDELFGY